jgi:hypothetical protein
MRWLLVIPGLILCLGLWKSLYRGRNWGKSGRGPTRLMLAWSSLKLFSNQRDTSLTSMKASAAATETAEPR